MLSAEGEEDRKPSPYPKTKIPKTTPKPNWNVPPPHVPKPSYEAPRPVPSGKTEILKPSWNSANPPTDKLKRRINYKPLSKGKSSQATAKKMLTSSENLNGK